MYLYGAGGHAKVVIEILEANQIKISGIYDDAKVLDDFLGYPVRLPEMEIADSVIITIGDGLIRKKIAMKYPVDYAKAIYPDAIISPRALIGAGTVVMQGAVIQSCATIGMHCIINTGATIGHDCTIENFAHVSSNATLCGEVMVGEGSWIGAGSTVIQKVNIGKWSIIGAGSVVVEDIPDGVLAYGNPCRVIRKIN